jgi:hypothetical protein
MENLRTLKGIRERIINLYIKGFNFKDIAKMVENKDYKVSAGSVKGIVKTYKTKTKQVMVEDEDLREVVKTNLNKLIDCSNENLNVLQEIRSKVLNKLSETDGVTDERMLLSYLREISNSIRAQNDSVRTLNTLLSSIKDTTKETEVTSVEAISKTVGILKDLEKDGYIEILPAYYNSPIYIPEEDKEEEEEKEDQIKQEEEIKI